MNTKTNPSSNVANGSIPVEQNTDQRPIFRIQRIYLKDLSLEQPNTPGYMFKEEKKTALEMNMNLAVKAIQDKTIFEVVVSITVTAKAEEQTIFMVELQQAGLFELKNIPEQQLEPLLHVNCPHMLFPYLRAALADVLQKGGFPPIHLNEANFQAIYEQHKARKQQQSTDTSPLNA
jgi:preprotein translocase subunit SecB